MIEKNTSRRDKKSDAHLTRIALIGLGIVVLFAGSGALVYAYNRYFDVSYYAKVHATSTPWIVHVDTPVFDKTVYDTKLLSLAHVATSSPWYMAFLNNTKASTTVPKPLWPIHAPYPSGDPIMPFNRIVAYYGNFYSTGMGVLGEYPEDKVLAMLASTTKQWAAADPSTPVVPAIDYIAVTAQGSAGADGKYRARMPDSQIQKAIEMANQIHGIVILDVQVGLSNVQTEIPLFKQYLLLPNMEIAIDPEFSMKDGTPPGKEIGTFDASDINWVANYMAQIVRENNLPPKVLVVHRFTEGMVTNYKKITPLSEVQIVMDMDGWGFPEKKINTYQYVVAPEPVQFTGLKLFYKADLRAPSTRMLTPAEVLRLTPSPIFIQYQ